MKFHNFEAWTVGQLISSRHPGRHVFELRAQKNTRHSALADGYCSYGTGKSAGICTKKLESQALLSIMIGNTQA